MNDPFSSFNWSFFKVLCDSLLRLTVGIIIIRLIPPKDFGVFSMAYVYVSFVSIFPSIGMGSAIVQRTLLTQEHVRMAVTLSLILGSLVGFLTWILAPAVAAFFGDQRLVRVLHVFSFQFPLYGPFMISYSLLVRSANFKAIFAIDLLSFLCGYSLVAIIMAVKGLGVWSLVCGALAASLLASVSAIAYVRPSFKPLLQKSIAKDLLVFGSGISAVNILGQLTARIDYILIGRYLSADALGLYSKALEVVKLPFLKLSQILYLPMFSWCARVQEGADELRAIYLRTINLVAVTAFPILTAIGISGHYVIVGLFGDKWEGAVPDLQVLVFAGAFMSLLSAGNPVIRALGKVHAEANRRLLSAIILGLGAFIGVGFGSRGVAAAVVAAAFSSVVMISMIIEKNLEIGLKHFLGALVPGLSISLIVGIFNYAAVFVLKNLLPDMPVPVQLIIIIWVCGSVFLMSLLLLPKSVKGEVPGWLLKQYSQRFPPALQLLIQKWPPIQAGKKTQNR